MGLLHSPISAYILVYHLKRYTVTLYMLTFSVFRTTTEFHPPICSCDITERILLLKISPISPLEFSE